MMDRASDNSTPDEAVLAAIEGRPGAWEHLVRMWSRRVFAAAQSRLRDAEAAEELTQSVMVTVYEYISSGKYAHTGQFESWLFRIAMNRVRDVVRRSQRHRFQPINEALDASAPAPPASVGGDQLEELRDALASLPEADQEVISLRHHAQLSFAAIAEMLEQPMGTVLARHHRAVAKLRAHLEPRSAAAEA